MRQHIFLSHDHRDDPLARTLSNVIRRVTLGQLEVWFSSDASPSGGIRPGRVWLDEVRERLSKSRAVLTLLTPNSLERPWLLFESGFGAGQANCEVVPVCVGLGGSADVPFPLAMYQCFYLTDLESLKRFVEKLVARYDITFDEEMAMPVLKQAIQDFVQTSQFSKRATLEQEPSAAQILDDLKQHLDRRFGELLYLQHSADGSKEQAAAGLAAQYSLPLEVGVEIGLGLEQHAIEVFEDTTVQDVLDNVYYMLSPNVEQFTYCVRWLLREKTSGLRMVIREMAHLVPAHSIFRLGTTWEVVMLDKPLIRPDGRDPRMWYRKPIFESTE